MEKTSPTKKEIKTPKIAKAKNVTAPKKSITKKEVEQTVAVAKEEKVEFEEKTQRYFEATGRRKTAVAVARLFTQGDKGFSVNDKPYDKYFATKDLQSKLLAPLQIMNCVDRFNISIKVRGGGLSAQAEATRHGISRALVLFNATFRKRLKKAGFLTRDSRMRERKKFGLKRARRAPQWSKR